MRPPGGILFEPPCNWISDSKSSMPFAFYAELSRRNTGVVQDIVRLNNLLVLRPESRDAWFRELFYVRALQQEHEYDLEPASLELLGRILCQALGVQKDCERKLAFSHVHNLLIFTNHRTIQVYCWHTFAEKIAVLELCQEDLKFQLRRFSRYLLGETYEKATEAAFRGARPCLVWECIFPEGFDMEALSPRDANAHIRVKQQTQQKAKAPVAKLTGKEKDHPPPPPPEVREPPSSDRPNGAIYQTGRLLGRGGFAICYEGILAGTKQKFALKVVKSHMPQKKMEQKFQTELQIHSKMKHENIVHFHRAFSYEKCTYIVLELCPNGSLMDMVKKRKFITEPEVRFWTVQMAGAIKYMHAKGIIHRDLKMGNIFLDKDMNVKIGDFGLAALLMSDRDMNACRRTTLCGTPNYIAPEILEKGKGGHDHAVDIWSLGIIIFAMLTGKPPFQSTTADEIYRRAREREYDWPKLNTSENFISDETKDLVSSLLQDPEQRPDPDAIVQHSFFTSGWLPQSEEMTPELCHSAPRPDQFLSVGVRTGRSNLYTKNLKKLCIKCEVGPWNPSPTHNESAYKQVTKEEKAGLTPAVPLPEDVVYRRFDEWLKEQAAKLQKPMKNADLDSQELLERLAAPPMRPAEQAGPSNGRVAAQSFASQQRARPQGSTVPSSSRNARSGQSENQNQQSSRAEASSRPMVAIPSRPAKSRKLETHVAEKVADVENRLATDLAEQLNKAEADRKSQEVAPLALNKQVSLFSPTEKLESISGTKPDRILDGLRRLQAELERALNSRSLALVSDAPTSSPAIVVKWVDYTNKFGLGYILGNGSVGCIFKETPADPADPNKGFIPPTCIVVRDAERHLQNRGNEAYMDRHQIVPISGPSIEFYENRGESGIYRGKVNAQNYRIQVSRSGEAGKLSRGTDDWDDRKREKIVLWKKFANYMTAFGRDQDYPYDDALSRTAHERMSEIVPAGNVVTFYQRFGDVGCWAFCDGHFQFNFPDHTKIVISGDGTWCDFYHLPLEAARDLSSKGTLPSAALDDRQHLSYPLQTLLNFMVNKSSRGGKTTIRKRPEIDPMLQGIPQANDFRRKVEFIRLVVKEWVANGGLGNSAMEPKTRLRWGGYRELVNVKVPYKHVWVTVGARNRDDRRVAWFDPKKPEASIPDIE